MAHKTITISEEAYRALKRMRHPNESFTRVIIRLTRSGKSPRDLLAFLKQMGPQNELADAVEGAYRERQLIALREVQP
jgi:predicted CopG family antitoxin